MTPRTPLLAAAFVFLAGATSSAEVLISFQNGVGIAPGKTGTIEVYVSSTGSDLLSSFQAAFLITGPSGQAFFASTQPVVYDDTDYVFYGCSTVEATVVGDPYETNYPNDSIDAADIFLDPTYIPSIDTDPLKVNAELSTTPQLLAKLEVSMLGSAPVGQEYEISLVHEYSAFESLRGVWGTDSDGNSIFYFDPFPLEFNSEYGTISAVPEPSSAVAWTGLVGAFVLRRCWQRRRQRCG